MQTRTDPEGNDKKIKLHPILPARLDWPSAIGNFLLNFGVFDYSVFVFLKDRLTSDEFVKIRDWHLKDRLDRIAEHMKKAKFPIEQQTGFLRLVARVDPLRELRNHIAHGHMLFSLDPDTGKPRLTLFKSKDLDTAYSSESKHLEFTELYTALTKTGLPPF